MISSGRNILFDQIVAHMLRNVELFKKYLVNRMKLHVQLNTHTLLAL